MIRWNGKRYVPAGVKPLMKRKGVNVPGMPKTKWIASWVGGESVPECDFTFDFILDPTPTPTPTITSSSTATPTPTATLTPTPTTSESGLDPDAAAYLADVIASGGTTDATIESAVNTLFVDLKSNGFYNKLELFYPFVGATASSHAINAKLNKSYDIIWGGGLTHDLSGTTGNATNGYGIFNWTSSNFTTNNASMGFYTLTPLSNWSNTSGWSWGFGSHAGMMLNRNGTDFRTRWKIQITTLRDVEINGQYSAIRFNNSTINALRNGNVIQSGTDSTSWSETGRYNIFATSLADGTPYPGTFTNDQMVFFYIVDDELNVSETQTLQNIINTFQTSLGRNTY